MQKFIIIFFCISSLATILSAQTGDAPDRPVCTSIEKSGPGTCDFNEKTELEGTRVVVFESGGGHGTIKQYLRSALERLSLKYGFIVDIRVPTDFTELTLSDAKVIIYSNNDGANMPGGDQAVLIEDFVRQRGWGLLMIHAACAFNGWQFLQDACIQQFHSQYPSQTVADIYVEDNTYEGEAHGRANPYTSFLLEGIQNRQTLNDEWYSWRGNPRTTHQYNRQSENKIMLTALDESTIQGGSCNDCNLFPGEHYLSWTHTMGRGIVLFNSIGGTDTYQQSPDDFGDEMLWRQLRYVAKDWGPTLTAVCTDPEAGNFDVDFDPNAEVSDESVCRYCGDSSSDNYVSGKEYFQYDYQLCPIGGIEITGIRVNNVITTNNLKIKINQSGKYQLLIAKANGDIILNINGFGAKEYPNAATEAGIYYVKLRAPGYKTYIQKLLVK